MNKMMRALGAAAMAACLGSAVPASAQMMGGGAAAAGNGVGGVEWGDVGRPAYDAATEYRNGVAELKAGQFRDAEHSFNHALVVDRDNADTYYQLAQAKVGEGDLSGAARA